MDKRAHTCCFTGHRPQSLPWSFDEGDPRCVALKARLVAEIVRLVTECGVKHFISGMALGVDTWAAEAVIRLRDTYNIALECALPCETQAVRWKEPDRERYFNLVAQCDYETMVQRHYDANCMRNRNRYMVKQSRHVIAVWDGRPSGTGQTVMYAREMGLDIHVLPPIEN